MTADAIVLAAIRKLRREPLASTMQGERTASLINSSYLNTLGEHPQQSIYTQTCLVQICKFDNNLIRASNDF